MTIRNNIVLVANNRVTEMFKITCHTPYFHIYLNEPYTPKKVSVFWVILTKWKIIFLISLGSNIFGDGWGRVQMDGKFILFRFISLFLIHYINYFGIEVSIERV